MHATGYNSTVKGNGIKMGKKKLKDGIRMKIIIRKMVLVKFIGIRMDKRN